jgi:hypothetical protein
MLSIFDHLASNSPFAIFQIAIYSSAIFTFVSLMSIMIYLVIREMIIEQIITVSEKTEKKFLLEKIEEHEVK